MDKSVGGQRFYKYALSLTSQFYFCCIPFRLDTTPKCDLNCSYCFAMSRGGRRTANNLYVNPEFLRRKLYNAFQSSDKNTGLTEELLRRKMPIHFGGMSDPFSNETASNISRELLTILSTYDYPVILSTKNTSELLKDKTLRILNSMKKIVVQVSLTTMNDKIAEEIEPNTPSPTSRIRDIENLSKSGFYTIARLQPLFFPWINEIAENLIPALGSSECSHVIVEYLKLPVEKNLSPFGRMFKAIGWDGYKFYKDNGAKLVGREWLLPAEFKWENLSPIIEKIHSYGMTYGSGDYGLNHMGDTDCCCGIDNVYGFSHWYKGNFSNVIRNAGSTKIIFDEVLNYWHPSKSIKRIINSNSRLKYGSTILDYLKKKWNSPGTANAPDSFLGISWNKDFDRNGNCIYLKRGTEKHV